MKLNANKTILRPYITERSSLASERGVYSFEVSGRATKAHVKEAIMELYKIKVVKVRMVNLPGKARFRGGKPGRSTGIRKAYVQVPEGTKIEFV